jgi:hypothetical protein
VAVTHIAVFGAVLLVLFSLPCVVVAAPCIEQIAADLRRLDRQRRAGPTTQSQRWLADVVRAYDERLRLASRCLGVTEYLTPLEGVDRDIERLWVEAELQAAGLSLRAGS